MIPTLISLATKEGYGKIFAKVPASAGACFTDAGFTLEATVERLYRGDEDGLFLGFYLDQSRREEAAIAKYERIRDLALSKRSKAPLKARYT